MKIIFDNPQDEPITDLAIANCIRNYITDLEWLNHEKIEIDGKKVLLETGNEQSNIDRHIKSIVNALLATIDNRN